MLARKFLLTLSLMFVGALSANAPLAAQQAMPPIPLGCTPTPVPADHQFAGLFAYQGDTLANVLPDDRVGEAMTTIRVTIEPGDKPITVMVSGRRVIWALEGDVARVQRVLALSEHSPVAVNGIARERVEFPAADICRMGSIRNQEDINRLKFTFPALFGRALDLAASDYSIHEVRLPAGEVVKPDPDRRGVRRHDLYSFYPGGIREFDPATLVSSAPLVVPEILPDMAGLMQLEQSGAIRSATREEVAAWNVGASAPYRSKLSPNYRLRIAFDYVVTREIAMPVGLNGAHSRKFLVLAGVPAPRGSPGHSCVAHMDGFRTGDAMSCHGEEREAIERLKQLPPDDVLAACRLIDVPSDSSVEAVSIYEPEGAVHSHRSRRVAVPVEVRVRKPGKVVLVLNTYEPAIWRVSFGAGTEIVGVLLGGYYKSEVEGIHPDVPVARTDYEGSPRLPPSSACTKVRGYTPTAYEGGPNVMLLERQVRALTGRPLDGVRGAYKVKEVEIR